jgi:UDP-glucose 4-epimerase
MWVVVTGASGNVGTRVLASLGRDPEVEEIVGLTRRTPRAVFEKTRWRQADVSQHSSLGACSRATLGRAPGLFGLGPGLTVAWPGARHRGEAPSRAVIDEAFYDA